MTSKSIINQPDLFVLEMHWMTGNRGDLIFKSVNGKAIYKIKRLANALDLVGLLVQLSIALGLSTYQTNTLQLRNNQKLNNWWIQYSLASGIVEWNLVLKNGLAQAEKVVFFWKGRVRDFRESIDRFVKHLPPYLFFEKRGV
ncbi:hypothetical protein ACXZ1K_00980 [Pedobacter sp. PWIIR3]